MAGTAGDEKVAKFRVLSNLLQSAKPPAEIFEQLQEQLELLINGLMSGRN
jgi:hypothetical protein